MASITLIPIANPIPGRKNVIGSEHATRLQSQGLGRVEAGVFVYKYPASKSDPARFHCDGIPVVLQFDGYDAFPNRAVLPPSGEVMAELSSLCGRRRGV